MSQMTRLAAPKITLFTSVLFAGFTVWGVHFLQRQEQDNMYKGVLRDEARQEAKRKRRMREQELEESLKKREVYEAVQVVPRPAQPGNEAA